MDKPITTPEQRKRLKEKRWELIERSPDHELWWSATSDQVMLFSQNIIQGNGSLRNLAEFAAIMGIVPAKEASTDAERTINPSSGSGVRFTPT